MPRIAEFVDVSRRVLVYLSTMISKFYFPLVVFASVTIFLQNRQSFKPIHEASSILLLVLVIIFIEGYCIVSILLVRRTTFKEFLTFLVSNLSRNFGGLLSQSFIVREKLFKEKSFLQIIQNQLMIMTVVYSLIFISLNVISVFIDINVSRDLLIISLIPFGILMLLLSSSWFSRFKTIQVPYLLILAFTEVCYSLVFVSALGLEPLKHFYIVLVINYISILIPLPSGIIGKEILLFYAFSSYASLLDIVAVSVLFRLITLLSDFVLGICSSLILKKK